MSYTKRQYELDHPELYGPQEDVPSDETDRARNAEWDMIWALIEKEYDAMLAEEGIWTVEHRYYADHEDAHMKRMYAAERRVREGIRQRKQSLNETFRPKEFRGVA